MMDINLLSPAEKKEVRLLRWYFIIKTLGFRLTSLIIVIGVVIVFGALLLKDESNSLASQIESERQLKQQGRITSLEEATSELNAAVQRAESIQNEYIVWSSVIAKVTSVIPDGITITSLQLNDSTSDFRLSGSARDRQTLLDFESSMQTETIFKSVSLPVSNLTLKENIPFEMIGELTSTLYE